MFRQSLIQKQNIKLSPLQILLMKLFQLPTIGLDQRVKEELETNPALEEGEEIEVFAHDAETSVESLFSDEAGDEGEQVGDSIGAEDEVPIARDEVYEMDDYLASYIEDDPTSYDVRADHSAEEEERSSPLAVENSLQDYLTEQLGLININKDEKTMIIATQIIGSLDEDGLLRRETSAIAGDILFSQNLDVTEEEVNKVLNTIQQLDPPGVGARDLRECLMIQLQIKLRAAIGSKKDKTSLELAYKILDLYFEEFSKRHYPRLFKQLNINDDQLKLAINEIVKLNPRPANGYVQTANRNVNYIIPDFIISSQNNGELELVLNSRNAPDLRVSEHYKEMLRAYRSGSISSINDKQQKEAVFFIKQKIDAAKWFIDAIQQRQQTMYKTMLAIMEYQHDFFTTGDKKRIRPMILKDIAEVTNLDISTISRVANSKFVQTEFGTILLKDFFSEAISIGQDGEEVSTVEVKNILEEMIAAEDKRKPLSDEKLMAELLEKNYNIARRTVAKYREQLNIPVARLRREL